MCIKLSSAAFHKLTGETRQGIVKQDKDMPFNEKITLKVAEKEIAAWIQ